MSPRLLLGLAVLGLLSCAPHEDLSVVAISTKAEPTRAGRSSPVPTSGRNVWQCIQLHGRGLEPGSIHAAQLLRQYQFFYDSPPDYEALLGLAAALCIARLDGLLVPKDIWLYVSQSTPLPTWRIEGAFDDMTFRTVEISADDGRLLRNPRFKRPVRRAVP